MWGRDEDRHTVADVELVVIEAGAPDRLCSLAVSAENDCDDTRMFLDCICCDWRAEVVGTMSVTANQLIAVASEHAAGRLGLFHGPDREPAPVREGPIARMFARLAADVTERAFLADRILTAPAPDASGVVIYDLAGYEAAATPPPPPVKYGARVGLTEEQWAMLGIPRPDAPGPLTILSSDMPDPTGYLAALSSGEVDPPGGVRPDAPELPAG